MAFAQLLRTADTGSVTVLESVPRAVPFVADENKFVSVAAIADGSRLALQLDGETVMGTLTVHG